MKRIGFGQVEPNKLSAQKTGQIFAQLQVAETINILENGQFVKYDYANGRVNLTGNGEWMLVFNEVKLYDDRWRETYKDFAMIRSNYITGTLKNSSDELIGEMVPRVFKTNIGDIFTTNCIKVGNTSGTAEVGDTATYQKGDLFVINSSGYLEKTSGALNTLTGMVWQVCGPDAQITGTTMPDGQPALKLQRIQ